MRKLSFRQSKKYTQSYPTGSWGSGIKHGFSIQSLEPPETQEVASAASLYTSEASPREAGQGRPTWGQGLWSQASHVHGRQIFFSSGSGSVQLLHQICGMVPQPKPAFLVSGISSFILQFQFKSRSAKLKFSLAIGPKE